MNDKIQNNGIVRFSHVDFSYYGPEGENVILQDMNFSIAPKSFTAIVGPSGCGKSTILSLISGLLKPVKGDIIFYSENFQMPKIGYMLQHDHLLEWRDVYHNILLGLEINKKLTPENYAFVDELLYKYNLVQTKNQKPSALSGGMRQRIALIRTLSLQPDLLLLDEPFSALDYQTRLNVSMDVYNIIKSEQKTAILVTHDISEAIALADTIILLSKTPCRITESIPIDFDKNKIARENARNSVLFQQYFDHIWRKMQNEESDI